MTHANILIVEDESIVAKDIEARLKHMGHVVVGQAPSGAMAIELAEKACPDLVLMDIMLKGEIDGIQSAEIIRNRLRLPVIFLTAFSDDATLARAKIAEPYGYILKPFEERELSITIEMALYKHRMERDRAELTRQLQEALANVETLQGLLPICCCCKKIRNDQGYWDQVESYLARYSQLRFSHSYCPDCFEKVRLEAGLSSD
ncbi:MAG: response regulator [Verrucomicrobiota bacterium]|jgi:two-component system, response regulator PdtaR